MGPPQYTLTGAPVTQIKDILPKGQSLVDPNSVPSILNPTPTGKTITNVNLSESLGLADAAQAAAQRNAEREANLQQRSIVAPLLIAGEKYQPEIKRDTSGFAGYFGFLPEASAQVQKKPINVNLAESLGVSESPRSAPPPRTVASDIFGVGGGFADLGGLDTKTVNNVNDFVSKAAGKSDSIQITIGGQTKSYSVQQALNGIFADIQNYKQQNPDSKNIGFSLNAIGTQTTTVRPSKQQTIQERNDLVNFVKSSQGQTITMKDANGNILGQTSGPRARFDIIKQTEKSGPLSLEFSQTSTSKSLNTPNAPSAVLGNRAGEVYGNPFGEFIKGSQATFANYLGLGKGIVTLKEPKNTTPTPLNLFLGGAVGATERGLGYLGITSDITGKPFPIDKTKSPYDIFSTSISEAGKQIQSRPFFSTGSLLAETGIQGSTLGLGKAVDILGGGVSKTTEYLSGLKSQQSVKQSLEALRTGEQEFKVTPIGGKLYTGEYGTEGIGGIEKINPEIKTQSFLVRSGPEGEATPPGLGIVKTVTTKLPNTVKNIFGIGAKGEPVGPPKTEVTLPNPSGSGIPKVPLAFADTAKGGAINIVRSELSDLKPTNILVKGEVPIERQEALGLKPSSSAPGFFEGPATPETLLQLRQAEAAGFIKPETDILGLGYSDFASNKFGYAAAVKNTDLFGKTETEPTTVYHGTSQEMADKILQGGFKKGKGRVYESDFNPDSIGAIFGSPSKSYAEQFAIARGGVSSNDIGSVLKITLKPNSKILERTTGNLNKDEFLKQAKSSGYDAVLDRYLDVKSTVVPKGLGELRILNPKSISSVKQEKIIDTTKLPKNAFEESISFLTTGGNTKIPELLARGLKNEQPENVNLFSGTLVNPKVTRYYETSNEGFNLPEKRIPGLEQGSQGLTYNLSKYYGKRSFAIDPLTGEKIELNPITPESTGFIENPFSKTNFLTGETKVRGKGTYSAPKPGSKRMTEAEKERYPLLSPLENIKVAARPIRITKEQVLPKQKYDYLGNILTKEEKQQSSLQTTKQNKKQRTEYGFEVLAYPRTTEERLTGKQIFRGTYGFDMFSGLTERQKEKQTQRDRFGFLPSFQQIPKQSQVPIQIPSLLTTEITIPVQGTTEIQTTKQETTPSLITEQFNVPKPPPSLFIPGNFAGLFPGGRSGNQKPGKKSRRSYILYSTNPNVVGDFYTKGLPEQGVSSSPSIFAKGEKAIAKATRGYEASALVSTTIGKKRSARTQIKSIFESGPIQTPKRKKSKAYKSVLSY